MQAAKQWLLCFITLLFLCCCMAVQAAPQVIMLLCPGIIPATLYSTRYPALSALEQHSALSLMNTTVPAGSHVIGSAMLTLACGANSRYSPLYSEVYSPSAIPSGETSSALQLYIQRTCAVPNVHCSMLHLGISALYNNHILPNTLGAALSSSTASISSAIYFLQPVSAQTKTAALLVLNSLGQGSGSLGLTSLQQMAACMLHTNRSLIVGCLPNKTALNQLLNTIVPQLASNTNLLICSPISPNLPGLPSQWRGLTVFIAHGTPFGSSLLRSQTTRTTGLVSLTDVAPTILHLLHSPAPDTFTGRPVSPTATGLDTGQRFRLLWSLNTISLLNGQHSQTIALALFIWFSLWILTGVLFLRQNKLLATRLFLWSSLQLLSLPAALMLAPLGSPASLGQYLLLIMLCLAALALLSLLAAPMLRFSAPSCVLFLYFVLLFADLLSGQSLIKLSLISSYALSGIRYYGMGNEYLGITLAFMLIGGCSFLDETVHKALFQKNIRSLVYLLWFITAILCGSPVWGANAGSIIITTVGIGSALLMLKNVPLNTVRILLLFTAGILLTFLAAAIDEWLFGTHASHAGRALEAASGGLGADYLAHIALRKLEMNIHLFLSPWLWLAVAIVAAAAAAARFIIHAANDFFASKPFASLGIKALQPALAASLIFKDSGVVTVVFAVAAAAVLMISYRVYDSAQLNSQSHNNPTLHAT